MSRKKAALPAPAPEQPMQPVLIDVPAVSFVATLEADGQYTAERLKAQRPDDYDIIVTLLGRGHGAQFIEDWFHKREKRMSKNTVKAVRRLEGETIDLLKNRLAERNFEFAEQADEAAALILSEIMSSAARRSVQTVKDVQALKVAAGIAVQNGQLLTGKPTANVTVEVFSTPSEDLNRQLAELYVNQLHSAAAPTHSGAEKNGAINGAVLEIESAVAGPATDAALAATTAALAATSPDLASPISAQDDKQSLVPTTQTTENQP